MNETAQEILLDFDRVAEKTGISIEAARNETINEAAKMIVQNTPVLSGRLRASWFFSPTFPTVARAANGAEINGTAGAAVLSRLGGEKGAIDGSLYLLNGANYAAIVNARQQFVDKVLGRAKAIEAAAIRKIRFIQGRK